MEQAKAMTFDPAKPYLKKVKSALVYLECGHSILWIFYSGKSRVVPESIECAECNPVTMKQIIAHGKKLEAKLKQKKHKK